MKTSIKQICEDYDVELLKFEMDKDSEYNCKHVVERDGVRFVPRVLEAKNQGGYDATLVCLDCILEKFGGNP